MLTCLCLSWYFSRSESGQCSPEGVSRKGIHIPRDEIYNTKAQDPGVNLLTVLLTAQEKLEV